MNKDNSKGEISQSPSKGGKDTFLTDDKPDKKKKPADAPQVDDATVRKRLEQALMFEKYLEESGLSLSF